MARPQGFTREDAHQALKDFILQSADLTEKAWPGSPMSSGRVASLLGAANFSAAVCDFAAGHAPADRSYTWSICPGGKRHKSQNYFRGTADEWLSGACSICEEQAVKRQQQPALPFRERYPEAVDHLANPADADSREGLVLFKCSDCGDSMSWSPKASEPPRCGWCRASNGAAPGDLVRRKGGGEKVRLEAELVTELSRLGLSAFNDLGIVARPHTYVVPVIKPDIVLPDLRLVVEVDHTLSNGWVHNRHDEPAGVRDDQLRDRLLAELGWSVLRIRRPDQPTEMLWPRRIESTSQSPRKLAGFIAAHLKGGP